MKLPPRFSRWVLVTIFFVLGFALPGCSKKSQVVLDAASFSSAPPELKERWTAAAGYIASKNYLGVATNLIVILKNAQQLSAEQKDALNQAWLRLGNEAFEAANRGDKAATEAVLKMKETGLGDRRGQR